MRLIYAMADGCIPVIVQVSPALSKILGCVVGQAYCSYCASFTHFHFDAGPISDCTPLAVKGSKAVF